MCAAMFTASCAAIRKSEVVQPVARSVSTYQNSQIVSDVIKQFRGFMLVCCVSFFSQMSTAFSGFDIPQLTPWTCVCFVLFQDLYSSFLHHVSFSCLRFFV